MKALLLITALLLTLAAAQAAGPTYADWVKYRDALLKDADLVRYYTFADVSATAPAVKNLAGEDAPLNFGQAAPGEDEKTPRVGPGRFAEKSAVTLDRGVYTAKAFPVENKTFSVEAWVRTHGQGVMKGDRPEQSATLLSAGNGYWDGWRITLAYPSCSLGLELGKRPGSYGIRSQAAVIDGSWHHLVATWNGQTACLYADGQLIASGKYEGDYVPASGGFRLGFADAGWGGAVADYDEVAVYKRALTPLEVLQHTLYYAPLDPAVAAKLAAADADPTVAAYQALLKTPGLHPHWSAVAWLRLAALYQQQSALPEALKEYVAVLGTSDLPDGLRSVALAPLKQLALTTSGVPPAVFAVLLKQPELLTPRERVELKLNLARSYAQAGKGDLAAKTYAEVLAMPDLRPGEKLDVMLQSAHGLAASKDYAAARKQYGVIVAQADAPAQFRAYAALCVARTYVLEKQYAAARKEYSRVRDMAAAPEILRWEAGDCLREVARLEKKLPARDPQWTRVTLPTLPKPAVELYVSPQGLDTNPGSKTKPFATLQRAQQAVRDLVAKALPPGGVVVNVAAGEYRLTESLAFTAADSGTAAAPVIWRAQDKGKVILTGGQVLPAPQAVTDPAILARLPEEARGKVMQVDLKAAGITQYDSPQPRGFGRGKSMPVMELFSDAQPLRLARWPNTGFVNAGKVISNDDKGAVFEYTGDRAERWTQAKDPWVFGYWKWLWAEQRDPVKLDTAAHTLTLRDKVTYGGMDSGAPYFIYNLLEEIDQPGEWYLDREAGKLYLYPVDPKAELKLSMLDTPLVTANTASWVILDGLTLEYGRWHGAELTDSDHCLLAGCSVRNVGGEGVVIEGGKQDGIFGCDLYNLGRGNKITGGDRKTLEPGGHFMENCNVHHFSRVDPTYTPAVLMNGCGNRIAHNSFHHSPGHAMRIEGNDYTIECNEIYEVVRESDDQGGLDMWANPSYRGVVLRYNYWHDIGNDRPCGQAGVRLDDAISGVWIYGNVFQRCSAAGFGGIQIHGGKDNKVLNCLFADCKYGISFSGWGPARWKEFLDSQWVQDKLHKDVEISQPPYSTKYTDLARLYVDEGVSSVWCNVAYNCGSFLTRDRGIQDLMDNTVTLEDPGFVDAAKGDFALKPTSRLRQTPGFRPIPVEEIGLYDHPWRATRGQ